MTTRSNRLDNSPRRARRVLIFGALTLCTFAFVSAATPPLPSVPNAAASERSIVLVQATTPVAEGKSPLDEPIRLITEAKQAMADVKDYSCVMVKKEKMGDKPAVENVISMKIRSEPFAVNMRWLEPKAMVGQEACYAVGKNDGKMRVKSAGLLGNLGFLSLDTDDARAKASSRHAINESGLMNTIDKFAAAWERERSMKVTRVKLAEYEFNKRRCTRVETLQTANPDHCFLFQRTVVYFDNETHLPIRVECYDWPAKDGDTGELAEVFSYVNLRLNVGLGDDVFNH